MRLDKQVQEPKARKDSDITRERIIRRAALEFEDGMYGILQTGGHMQDIPPPKSLQSLVNFSKESFVSNERTVNRNYCLRL